jgi:hypothetical protein
LEIKQTRRAKACGLFRLGRLLFFLPKMKMLDAPILFPNDMTHCADLTWFTTRYPMVMEKADQLALKHGQHFWQV